LSKIATASSGCCARTASGHAVALPSSVRNGRYAEELELRRKELIDE